MTNSQNWSWQWLLSWNNFTWIRWPQTFDPTKKPIRYIFWGNISKQGIPVWYDWTNIVEYGSNWYDYISTRYIAEPESTLPATQQAIINQYFWSGSIYTQNWQTNWCSLSAFQVVQLTPQVFLSTYTFQDHTIYILTGGNYISHVGSLNNWFTFGGNCIAVVGTNDTKIVKTGPSTNSIFYANNKRNIIIDNVKVDWTYYTTTPYYPQTKYGIQFDGASNNNTFNNIQVANNSQYGIYLGLSSHHNTIINAQIFNNIIAWIHLYYASNYNVINNTQIYNNSGYGIWFANGSNRNTMNNFQAYNNDIWIFGDLTTTENILNRAAIYNNSSVGIYFKNSSGNVLNDVRIYNNGIGIRTLYSSLGNTYYGDLNLFDNVWWNFDGTSGHDTYLSPGSVSIFPYWGIITTGINMMSCLDATNPTLSWTTTTLLNSGTCNTTGFVAAALLQASTYVNYQFWLHMYKQKIPVRYESGNTQPVQIPTQYDANKYIAEIFAIRDNTPEWMIFTSSGAIQLNTWYTTNVYTAGVLNVAVPVLLTFTGGSATGYLTISWTNVGLTWTVNNGDLIQIHVLSRTWYSETVTWSITLWSVTTTFTVTTRWANQLPTTGSLVFASFTGIQINTFTWNSTTIAGLETGVSASITFLPVTTSGRLEVYSGTTLVSSWTTGVNVVNGNQVKVIAQSSSWYAQTITWYITIGLGTGMFTLMTKWSDITPPTTPSPTYPLSGEELFFITFNWNASTDTWSWLEWYEYQIAEDTSFVDIINTGFITTISGTVGSPNSDFDITRANEYYWRIKAKDRDGNYSARSTTWYFQTIEFGNRDFTNTNDANLRTYYDSNTITLEGIKPWLTLWASVDGNWILYKNGTAKWTGTLVQNGDDLYITLRSSNTYDDTVASVLTIANRTAEFAVTTKLESSNWCSLTPTDEETIQTIFDSLVANYSGEANKFDEFLYTMQSMLADQIDFTNDCNLQYLQDLINSAIGGNLSWSINTGNHIAPNCKEYPVSYDAVKVWYTSPVFKVITYFSNRDSLARYIDSKNPGDCHINTYAVSSWIFTNTNPNTHTASNGKMYTIQNTNQWYTSAEFSTAKYFGTLAGLRNYIDSHNIPQAIRSHQVDTSFSPQTYTAPNGKEYMIYKTDRWYMSYKLIKVRYFSTLSEIQNFIKTNNK